MRRTPWRGDYSSGRTDEGDRDAADTLAPAREPHALVRRRLDADRRPDRLGQVPLHLGPVLRQPRALADHGRVDVDHGLVEHPEDGPQEVERVGVAPALLVGREVGAEVAEPGGAEQRVDDRVGERRRRRSGPRDRRSCSISTPPRTSLRPAAKRWRRSRCRSSSERLQPTLPALEHGDLLDPPPAHRLDRLARSRSRRARARARRRRGRRRRLRRRTSPANASAG